MPRAIWKGAISFGLVNIPVSLYSGSVDNQLDLDMIDKRDFAPVGYRRVNKRTGRELEPANIVWCTGFHAGFEWIEGLPRGDGEPAHRSGIVDGVPGLFFVGLHFLHALSSTMIHGVGRDAERIARAVEARGTSSAPTGPRAGQEAVASR